VKRSTILDVVQLAGLVITMNLAVYCATQGHYGLALLNLLLAVVLAWR